MTAFERERERTIARNKARMEALNISTLSADVGGKSGAVLHRSQPRSLRWETPPRLERVR